MILRAVSWSGWRVCSSSMKSASDASVSPIGASRETVSRASSSSSSTLSAGRSSCLPISAEVGWRPRSCTSSRCSARHAVDRVDHVDRDPDRARLVGDRARHGLANPPGGVGRELEALAIVELLDRADQPEVALLDQVEQVQPAAHVALGDGHDEAQVGLDQRVLGVLVALLDQLREAHLVLRRQQRDPADLLQVGANRVGGGQRSPRRRARGRPPSTTGSSNR